MGHLGRRIPTDFEHVEKFPFSTVEPVAVDVVNHTMSLPSWHWTHDQGHEGSSVGHGIAMERAITNTRQNRLLQILYPGRRYDPLFVWNEAKKIDEWPDTNPGDDNGTSVRAGYDVCRLKGLPRVTSMRLDEEGNPYPYKQTEVDVSAGISANRWARTVDEIRTALASNLPVAIGVNWYSNFDRPVGKPGSFGRTDYWIGEGDLKSIRGGHCLCIYGARDDKQAFKLKNSWGYDYPLVFLPYATMGRLLNEDGEAAIVTDR